MKVNTLDNCRAIYKSYKSWEYDQYEVEKQRENILREFPVSVLVEGNCLEYDMVVEWLKKNIGAKNDAWMEIWYGKFDYDYGFWEFFFKDKKYADVFRDFVPLAYADATSQGGKKWRTDGHDGFIDL